MKAITATSIILGMFLGFMVTAILAEDQKEEEKKEVGTRYGNWLLDSLFSVAGTWTQYDNWQAGGANSAAVIGQLGFSSIYATDRNEWKTKLNISYGATRLKGSNTRKSSDAISFETQYNYKLTTRWSLYGRFVFNSQMTKGYIYFENPVDAVFFEGRDPELGTNEVQISDSFDPSSFDESIGVAFSVYKNEKNKDFIELRAGPGARQLTVSQYYIQEDDPATEEIEFSKVDSYTDYGAECGFGLQWSFQDNIKLTSSGSSFYGFKNELWKSTWDTKLVIQINKYFGVVLSNTMLYDENIINEYQWKTDTLLTLNYRLF